MGQASAVWSAMVGRLLTAMVNGPSMNCRPHASRQRVDLASLARLADADATPAAVVRLLLGEGRSAKLVASVPAPRGMAKQGGWRGAGRVAESETDEALTPAERAARRAFLDQQLVIGKLRAIAEDARLYEQDTGVHVLALGFPLLSLPPGSFGAVDGGVSTRRVLAPVALIPLNVVVKAGPKTTVELECWGDGTELVRPNEALLAWLARQAGAAAAVPEGLFADESGEDPWREIRALVRHVAKVIGVRAPDPIGPPPKDWAGETGEVPGERPIDGFEVVASPTSEEDEGGARLVCAGVLGLFPQANQGLLRDTQALDAGEEPAGVAATFVRLSKGVPGVAASETLAKGPEETVARPPGVAPAANASRDPAPDRFIAQADPCQARAVRLARSAAGLVVHGPPGTGKSQTIANIIGDHLARGERVLFVCDKRTALDVVYQRLDHLGLGALCAVVHDPQRDQRELYRSIREQLDGLTEARTDVRAARRLAEIDAEVAEVHAELTRYHVALHGASGAESLHELVGRWLSIDARVPGVGALETAPAELDARERDVREALRRAADADFSENPWREAVGATLEDLLARAPAEVARAAGDAATAAAGADQTIDAAVPAFAADEDLAAAGFARARFAEDLSGAIAAVPAALFQTAAGRNAAEHARAVEASRRLAEAVARLDQIAGDVEFDRSMRLARPQPAQVAAQLATLARYLDAAGSIAGWFAFGAKSAARGTLNGYGLRLDRTSAERLVAALRRSQVRAEAHELLSRLGAAVPEDDADLRPLSESLTLVLALRGRVDAEPGLRSAAEAVIAVLADPAAPRSRQTLDGLRRSPARAEALAGLERAVVGARLFHEAWSRRVCRSARAGEPVGAAFAGLLDRVGSVEAVVRTRGQLAALPPALREAVTGLVLRDGGAPAEDEAWAGLTRAALESEIRRRLAAEPLLHRADPRRLDTLLSRLTELGTSRQEAVRASIRHDWTARQRERLLSVTGSRLSANGADLKRRLTLRGERAMRLRQVVATGRSQYAADGGVAAGAGSGAAAVSVPAESDAGESQGSTGAAVVPIAAADPLDVATSGRASADPLFDLRPVWMASPETVAQVFPREPVFDVVIFDEASQCRLEEALPVLTRARRVVIAGDPRQLPPTRFFESAMTRSDDPADPEGEQELFEAQQAANEDLLEAALGLDLEQCYLDVHYRSRDEGLIQFSNEHFYASRLSTIPAHPSRVAEVPPVALVRADGVYAERRNEAEADRVVEIVGKLLDSAEPPSIGIACFNLTQRDLILDKLDAKAEEDAAFARRLAEARQRRGSGSFEGLFVKNLENVQGDERDHLIISTTYGPDPTGKFRRQFGPVGQAGGGRRLNVLITRARERVHLVTSIPTWAYRSLPPVPAGATPGGAWLLMAYLRFAESLEEMNEADSGHPADVAVGATNGAANGATNGSTHGVVAPAGGGGLPQVAVPVVPVQVAGRSVLVDAIARRLFGHHGLACVPYWGNEGLGIDLALRRDGRYLGVLCDGSRYTKADDPVEWDAFRVAIHRSQGWVLHRVWSPHLFRDPEAGVAAVVAAV